MGKVIGDQINLAGLSYSRFSGPAGSVATLKGFDIHSEPGLLRVAQALVKDSGTTVTEFCRVAVHASNGEIYFFSNTSGKIWARNTSGVYRQVLSTSDGAACTGAREYNNHIYWAAGNYLHRIALGNATATSWTTTAEQNWQLFDNGDADYHPMFEVNDVLYIGDGYLIAQVDQEDYAPDALDLPAQYRAKNLTRLGTDLLIGTFVTNDVNAARIFRWNTWSQSWTDDAQVNENGINAVFPFDSLTILSAGSVGNLYTYAGSYLQGVRRLPGVFNTNQTVKINPESVGNILGNVLFGISEDNGNPTPQGVYQLGRHAQSFPLVLDFPYPISTGHTDNIEIGAIIVAGLDVYVTWKDNNNSTTGVDKLDYSTKIAQAVIETMVIVAKRDEQKNFVNCLVPYIDLPEGTSVDIKYRVSGDSAGAWIDPEEVKVDTERKLIVARFKAIANILEVQITVNSEDNDAPSIQGFYINTTP